MVYYRKCCILQEVSILQEVLHTQTLDSISIRAKFKKVCRLPIAIETGRHGVCM